MSIDEMDEFDVKGKFLYILIDLRIITWDEFYKGGFLRKWRYK